MLHLTDGEDAGPADEALPEGQLDDAVADDVEDGELADVVEDELLLRQHALVEGLGDGEGHAVALEGLSEDLLVADGDDGLGGVLVHLEIELIGHDHTSL